MLAALEANQIGVFLVTPFGATQTILMLLPDAPVAQSYALIVGSVCGAAVGMGISFLGNGLGGARHDRCVYRYQYDLRLPSSRSRPGIDSGPTSPGIGFLCWSCFHSQPQP